MTNETTQSHVLDLAPGQLVVHPSRGAFQPVAKFLVRVDHVDHATVPGNPVVWYRELKAPNAGPFGMCFWDDETLEVLR